MTTGNTTLEVATKMSETSGVQGSPTPVSVGNANVSSWRAEASRCSGLQPALLSKGGCAPWTSPPPSPPLHVARLPPSSHLLSISREAEQRPTQVKPKLILSVSQSRGDGESSLKNLETRSTQQTSEEIRKGTLKAEPPTEERSRRDWLEGEDGPARHVGTDQEAPPGSAGGSDPGNSLG